MTGEAPTYTPSRWVPNVDVCSLCSALVEDEAAHTTWHAHLADAVSRLAAVTARRLGHSPIVVRR